MPGVCFGLRLVLGLLLVDLFYGRPDSRSSGKNREHQTGQRKRRGAVQPFVKLNAADDWYNNGYGQTEAHIRGSSQKLAFSG